ncbi:hypothetical protein ACFL4U_03100 [Candidatus Neomarinimicrobiota bacterium]
MNTTRVTHWMLTIALLGACTVGNAQEPKTLMGPGTEVGFVWGLGTKTGKIQDDIGRANTIHFGALLNHALLFGVEAGMNVTHPTVNHGYTAIYAQYTHKPDNLIHFSGQVLLGSATTKDYEAEKSSPYDNFGNITGPRFYIIEPGVNVEANLHVKAKLVMGLSYRIAYGLDEDHELIATTGVTNKDFSGIQFNLGIKAGKY